MGLKIIWEGGTLQYICDGLVAGGQRAWAGCRAAVKLAELREQVSGTADIELQLHGSHFPHLLLYGWAPALGGLAWTVPEKLLLSLLCVW